MHLIIKKYGDKFHDNPVLKPVLTDNTPDKIYALLNSQLDHSGLSLSQCYINELNKYLSEHPN